MSENGNGLQSNSDQENPGGTKQPSSYFLHGLRSIGGLNNFDNFSRSIRRAANFKDLQPILRTTLVGEDPEEYLRDEEQGLVPEQGPTEERDETQQPGPMRDLGRGQPPADEESPLLGGPSSRGPLKARLHETSKQRADRLSQQREESRAQQKEEDREPLLVKKITRDDGTEVEVIVGQSTVPQTIFNSSNVLLGVGMLSLPLGIRYAGWVIGLIFLVASAFVTRYTASLLAKCVDVDTSLSNFADIAYIAFGEKGRIGTSALFTLELTAACVALVILFADSLDSLIPGRDATTWKIICGLILTPLNFFPMKWLSYTSFLGIFCVLNLLLIVFIDGFLKKQSPGSLLHPAVTYAFPQHWKALPLSFGLIMAPWGGHSVFPNIYRDMRHPWKYERGLRLIFTFTTSMDACMAILGVLMFGNATKDEITTNILVTDGYPRWLDIIVLILISIVPLTKHPLNCSPIVSTLEVATGIDPRAALLKPNRFNTSKALTRTLKALFRIGVVVIIVILAILVPSFEVISAIMGAAFCFTICVILPVVFHLKMFGSEISRWQKTNDWILIIASTILAVVGTVWEFLPREWMGVE